MSWETTVLTWSNWSLSYSEIIAYSDKIAVVARLVIVIVLTLTIYIFRKKKKSTFKDNFLKVLPRIWVAYVWLSFIKFLYDSRSKPENILIVVIYIFLVRLFSTLFFWSISYAKACMNWDDHPQRTAIKKSWPYGFVVLTAFSLISFIVWLIF